MWLISSPPVETHGPPACCGWGPPFGSCDGSVVPTSDSERGKDCNHATYIDLVVEGLVGVRAALGRLLVVQPSADPAAIEHFAPAATLSGGSPSGCEGIVKNGGYGSPWVITCGTAEQNPFIHDL